MWLFIHLSQNINLSHYYYIQGLSMSSKTIHFWHKTFNVLDFFLIFLTLSIIILARYIILLSYKVLILTFFDFQFDFVSKNLHLLYNNYTFFLLLDLLCLKFDPSKSNIIIKGVASHTIDFQSTTLYVTVPSFLGNHQKRDLSNNFALESQNLLNLNFDFYWGSLSQREFNQIILIYLRTLTFKSRNFIQ